MRGSPGHPSRRRRPRSRLLTAIDRTWLESTLADLVSIESINPDLVEGASGEARIAACIAEVMESIGLLVDVVEPRPGRPSVVGRLEGTGDGPTMMWNGHIDTVGVEGMEAPFEPRIEDGRLYGRGAYDMKGSVAAMLAAAKALVDSGTRPAGDLLVACVADEEVTSRGTMDVLERYAIDGAIVTEPTQMELCLAHKGFAWIEVETKGVAAHGSRFEEGVDANLRMGRVLARLEDLERDLRSREGHPLTGPPSLHASTLSGGTGWSTYSDRCVLGIERRTAPGETEASALAEIEAILDALRDEDPDFEAEARVVLSREPFEADAEGRVAAAVRAAGETVFGEAPKVRGETYWMDAALCAAKGIDTVVIGPVGEGAHADVEWVDLGSCASLAEVLTGAAGRYCGAD